MLKEDHGSQNLAYKGTIIDIETIGDYCREYKGDLREYKDLKMVIFGYINKQGWHIYCAIDIKYIPKLEEKAKQLLITLKNESPLYAFNCNQEKGVFFHRLNEKILMKELQSKEYERKDEALRKLGIVESYGDPFHGDRDPGKACMRAWESGDFDKAVQHNRACLLKEQELLLRGRGRGPEPLDFKIEASSSASFNASFQLWTREEESCVRKAWREGNTLKTIAQGCKRTPKATWIRLQILKEIPAEILYTIEKDSFTIRDLQG
ncbi:MAG: hypothetical protein WB564_01130 [Dehalococcoidia bacterium]